jgi:multidrug efflux pump subunit AcrA (membrane-fusion protein)
MLAYHDREWGVPRLDDRGQFELLVLESAQAGLSWRTVLERREGLSVPQEAVLSRAAGTVAFVAQADGTAKEVPVEVGLRDAGRAEILSGLAPGDPVVVQGQTQLYDGRKIGVK